MQMHPSGRSVGDRFGEADAATVGAAAGSSPVRRSPIHWLILCGVLLIAAIVVGTAVMVGNFRERALSSSERELENTVLLLARHFDQQLEDAEVIQNSWSNTSMRPGSLRPRTIGVRCPGATCI